ncbi:hypothetical protein AOQ84DRAFT_411666 [Glonium stellatum]|uniref:Uncharacterized protein n=1 Tax=Glonium stellatum TaxID=574774 RepID=A0A8E2JR97_9PEZI|nr:hypothetical protein AOQ84DRAFT_411666 [Glonium stellatum]
MRFHHTLLAIVALSSTCVFGQSQPIDAQLARRDNCPPCPVDITGILSELNSMEGTANSIAGTLNSMVGTTGAIAEVETQDGSAALQGVLDKMIEMIAMIKNAQANVISPPASGAGGWT